MRIDHASAMYLQRDLTPILARHGARLELCRRRIVARLCEPFVVLGDYLERGKLLRAALVLLSCAAVGGDPDQALAAAEAVELLHSGSLVHDDVIDEADERRGLLALHRRVGESAALVHGDSLLVRAFETLTEAVEQHPPSTVVAAVETLGELARECCRGQLQELEISDRSASEAEYLSVARGKTGAPFVAACVLGGLMGGATTGQLERLREYGMNLGVAFQIFDDMLDLVGSEGLMGKPVGNSLAHGRPMLPLIYLREHGVADETLQRLVSASEPRDWVLRLLVESRVLERLRVEQASGIDTAVSALADLAPSVDVELLRALPARATAWWVEA